MHTSPLRLEASLRSLLHRARGTKTAGRHGTCRNADYRLAAAIFLFLGLTLISIPVDADEVRAADDDTYVQLLAAGCDVCHGGATPAHMPGLDGLSAHDMRRLLRAYREGRLQGTIMNRIAAALSDDDIDRLSDMLGH